MMSEVPREGAERSCGSWWAWGLRALRREIYLVDSKCFDGHLKISSLKIKVVSVWEGTFQARLPACCHSHQSSLGLSSEPTLGPAEFWTPKIYGTGHKPER